MNVVSLETDVLTTKDSLEVTVRECISNNMSPIPAQMWKTSIWA